MQVSISCEISFELIFSLSSSEEDEDELPLLSSSSSLSESELSLELSEELDELFESSADALGKNYFSIIFGIKRRIKSNMHW